MMTTLAWIVAAIALAFIVVLYFLLRVRRLLSAWGSSQCAVRGPMGWHTGVVFFREASLDWYAIRSLSHRPKISLPRAGFRSELQRRRETDPPTVVVIVEGNGKSHLLAMGEQAYNALVVWEDSAPPASSLRLF